jgi:hypothetical protein
VRNPTDRWWRAFITLNFLVFVCRLIGQLVCGTGVSILLGFAARFLKNASLPDDLCVRAKRVKLFLSASFSEASARSAARSRAG